MTHDDWVALLRTVQEITETIWLTEAFILPFIYVYLFVRDLPLIIYHFRSGDWKRRLPDPGPPPLEPVIPRRRRGFSNDEPTLIIQSIDDRTSIYTTGPLPHTTRARIGRLNWVRRHKTPYTPATTTRRVGKHRAAK